MKAIILAGGKGTRLAPYTTVLPKPLMPVDDRPILDIVIRQLIRHGITEIIISVGYLAELLEAYFQDGSKFGISIKYARESKPLGTAGPLALIADQFDLGDTFLMMNGDVLTTLAYSDMIDYHRKHDGVLTIAMHTKQEKVNLGVMHINDSNELTDYIEKPVHDYNVSMGIYVFNSDVLQHIEWDVKLDFNDLVLRLISAGKRVMAYPSSDYWLDIGRPDDYQQASDTFVEHRSEFLGEG
ncbi:MAG: NTP transferase domain-containing protein [Candidatus Latescibacteria bacterium]|jgi:NDP-mannose synthase|nr:NTP transferase domain-containing protein [Candidatus Latescibacterota bacterium]